MKYSLKLRRNLTQFAGTYDPHFLVPETTWNMQILICKSLNPKYVGRLMCVIMLSKGFKRLNANRISLVYFNFISNLRCLELPRWCDWLCGRRTKYKPSHRRAVTFEYSACSARLYVLVAPLLSRCLCSYQNSTLKRRFELLNVRQMIINDYLISILHLKNKYFDFDCNVPNILGIYLATYNNRYGLLRESRLGWFLQWGGKKS